MADPKTPPTPRSKSLLDNLLVQFGAQRSHGPIGKETRKSIHVTSRDELSGSPASVGIDMMESKPISPVSTSISGYPTTGSKISIPEETTDIGIHTPPAMSSAFKEDKLLQNHLISEMSQSTQSTVKNVGTPTAKTPSERTRPVLLRASKTRDDTLSVSPVQTPRPTNSPRKQNLRILESDTVPDDSPIRCQKSLRANVMTARGRVRNDMVNTKIRRDNFLSAHAQFLLPLLPRHNYIANLTQQSAVIPYKDVHSQPRGITATLKPYQLTGLSFLVHLFQNGMPGILGDEMGLGKTLQTISLFLHLEENFPDTSEQSRPFLVVCPLSVIGSWNAEIEKWAPSLKALVFHGTMEERKRLKLVALGMETLDPTSTKKRKRDAISNYKVIITTYEVFAAEKGWFQSAFVWRYVVLDEGHRIKNKATHVSSALQALSAEHRLILTGTPLQNNLLEMWALLHWLLPDVFTDKTSELFSKSFDLSNGRVDTDFLDHARRLLEIIMLRRMKSSPEVDLRLPTKTEVLLYVPLTPMQRSWYMRLLTNAGDSFLGDLFTNASEKEMESIKLEAADDLGASESAKEAKKPLFKTVEDQSGKDKWNESRAIMRQAEQQQNQHPMWKKLMNLILQLRKCCCHPYLLPGAVPKEGYNIGRHIVLASGKFIVLQKLLDHLLRQGKKVLIFSFFTKLLDCVEELLMYMGTPFLRFDGSTGRARRNLVIRLFNTHNEHQVMLISTRAGGLGINLTSASNVIFMDEDWNPQVTLQAEARAHRIGQTQSITIYKLCTSGTVEEQMMGRIRKKLYLSTKITESMQSAYGSPSRDSTSISNDVPQLSTNQLKSLVRRGAQALSQKQVDPTDMLSWTLQDIMDKCADKLSDAQEDEIDEEEWLSVMEKVECAVFEGRKHHKKPHVETVILPDTVTREDRRKGKNTTVMVDGFAVSKQSLRCADWEAVPTMARKDPRLAEPVRRKKAEIVNQDHCHACYDGGELYLCSGCPRSYHKPCLTPQQQAKLKGIFGGNFQCSQHFCNDCRRTTNAAGGMLYRCRWCPQAFCEDCLDFDKTTLVGDSLKEFDMLGFHAKPQAYYIVCPSCSAVENQAIVEEQTKAVEAEYQTWLQLQQVQQDNEMEIDSPSKHTNDSSSVKLEGTPSLTSGIVTESVSGISTPKFYDD